MHRPAEATLMPPSACCHLPSPSARDHAPVLPSSQDLALSGPSALRAARPTRPPTRREAFDEPGGNHFCQLLLSAELTCAVARPILPLFVLCLPVSALSLPSFQIYAVSRPLSRRYARPRCLDGCLELAHRAKSRIPLSPSCDRSQGKDRSNTMAGPALDSGLLDGMRSPWPGRSPWRICVPVIAGTLRVFEAQRPVCCSHSLYLPTC